MKEEVISTAKAYLSGSRSKVVVIPMEIRKRLGEKNTDLFIVTLDEKQRIIFTPIKKE